MPKKSASQEPPAAPPAADSLVGAAPSLTDDDHHTGGDFPVVGDFPIVGVGASAGGLAAFEAFFSGMPVDADPGMAFVLVQHLAPDHKSILRELVGRYTRMQVFEVEDGMEVHANCVYIIPPNRDMAFLNGRLRLLEQAALGGLRLPIDFLFRSLAQDQRDRAIGVVLSGTGSDGTLGLRAIKGEGGLTMAQEPSSTEYDGMPRSAIATGLVDFVLPPREMAPKLLAVTTRTFRRARSEAGAEAEATNGLNKVCVLLRTQTGHDFSQYKTNTLSRRVERRMAIHQIAELSDYVRFAQRTPQEVDALFRDLLIGVTSFFRDPGAWKALAEKVIPDVLARQTVDGTVRIWIPACSTGEEAYSMAILFHEHLEAAGRGIRLQIFATDIDDRAIAIARSGVYPTSVANDIGAERVERCFVEDPEEHTYRVRKHIRDLLIFSEQDIIGDPPFSRLDLVSCRNLLIYLNPEIQRRLIPLFHYALNPGGVLFLGSSETVGDFTSLFAPIDRTWKLYSRQPNVSGTTRFASPGLPGGAHRAASAALPRRPSGAGPTRRELQTLTEQALLEHYAQVGVLVDQRGDILHIFGRTGRYLEPAPGEARLNILAMARDGLRRELTMALHRAVKSDEPVSYRRLRVRNNGDSANVDLTVVPVEHDAGGTSRVGLFLVIIEELPPTTAPSDEEVAPDTEVSARIVALEHELRAKDEYLQTTLEEMVTSNEELKSTNEELQSVNEELQSANEELETSKEELQSVNEELSTVNSELQAKVADLSRANNDLNNLLAGTGIGTLFVDHLLRISRFTPAVTQVINLIPSDVGRPVGHVVSNLMGYDRLVEDVVAVLDTLVPSETEVQTKAGTWHLMRIRPYRTLDNVIEGAVITFADITSHKKVETSLQEAHELAVSIVSTVREGLVILDRDLRVVMANAAFCAVSDIRAEEAEGFSFFELGRGHWEIPALRRLLAEIARDDGALVQHEVTHEFERSGRRTLVLNARRVRVAKHGGALILLAIEDVSGRRDQSASQSERDE